MIRSLKDVEPMVYESGITVPYSWWAGHTADRFLTALKDEKKILGTTCDSCGRVFVPPKKTCPCCFTENIKWIAVSSTGTLVSYTIARRQLAALNKNVPVMFGLIRLDGADTAMLHYIRGIDEQQLFIGMRLEAIFAENAEATINAIDGFTSIGM